MHCIFTNPATISSSPESSIPTILPTAGVCGAVLVAALPRPRTLRPSCSPQLESEPSNVETEMVGVCLSLRPHRMPPLAPAVPLPKPIQKQSTFTD